MSDVWQTLQDIFNPGGARARYEAREWRAATARWTGYNTVQDMVRICACGAPGTVRRVSPYPVRGDVQPHWWRCTEHLDPTIPI